MVRDEKADFNQLLLDGNEHLKDSILKDINDYKKRVHWGKDEKIIIAVHWGGYGLNEYKAFLGNLNEKNKNKDYAFSYWGSQAKSYRSGDLERIKREICNLSSSFVKLKNLESEEINALKQIYEKLRISISNGKEKIEGVKKRYELQYFDNSRLVKPFIKSKISAHFVFYSRSETRFVTLKDDNKNPYEEYDLIQDDKLYNEAEKNYQKGEIWSAFKDLLMNRYQLESSLVFPDMFILFVLQQDLSSKDFIEAIYKMRADNRFKKPVITICLKTLREVIEDKEIEAESRIQFLDHSIWNRFFGLNEINLMENHQYPQFVEDSDGEQSLVNDKKILNFDRFIDFVHACVVPVAGLKQNIKFYKWYQTNVAKEYVEFNNRLLKNSQLAAIGGHARHIKPFVFHSEAFMRKSYLKGIEKEVKSGFQKLNDTKVSWRFLLIDDHINLPLSPFETRSTDFMHLRKHEIVKNLLEMDGWKIGMSGELADQKGDNRIIIESVETLKKAVKKLKKTTYDVILLDFLLSNKHDGTREYGHELLELIESDKNLQIKANPLNYYWCLILSAFPQAFMDKLRERGLSYHSNYWHLARGADPVNTPELFKYSLYKLMELQVKEVEFTKDEIIEHFWEHYFQSKQREQVRSWAKSYYQIFISKFGRIHLLKNNTSSLFSQSFCHYFITKRNRDLVYYEKMKNFLYLIANGTSNDKGQLQMSYMELGKESYWNLLKEEKDSDGQLYRYIHSKQGQYEHY